MYGGFDIIERIVWERISESFMKEGSLDDWYIQQTNSLKDLGVTLSQIISDLPDSVHTRPWR